MGASKNREVSSRGSEVLPEIQQAVHVDHLVYGYTYAKGELIKAKVDWERDEWLRFLPGMPCLIEGVYFQRLLFAKEGCINTSTPPLPASIT